MTPSAAPERRSLDPLLAPRSVAVAGVSADPDKLGSKSLENLLLHGFTGPVYPIHPREATVQGRRCYASFADLPEPADLAFIVLPAAQCVAAAWDAARRGVRGAVIAASGFREAGTPEGIRLQEELERIPRETGMRILGPNTNGFYNARCGVSIGYNGAHAETHVPGPLTVLSHSGALFSTFTGRMRDLDLGLGAYVALGGEADVTILELMEWAIEDPECRVVGLVIEAIRDAARFRAVAGRAHAAGKRVLALKLGRSRLGQVATQAHSSRLAGSARAYDALFRQCGVLRADTPEGFVTAAALLVGGTATGPALGGVTTTGAGAALLADAAEQYGLSFAALGAQTRTRLDRYRKFAPVQNPIDVGATGIDATADVVGALAADEEVGAIVLYAHQLLRVASRETVVRGLSDAHARSGKPTVVLAPGGLSPAEESGYRAAGILTLRDTASCFEGLRAVAAGAGPALVTAAAVGAPQVPPGILPLLALARPLTEAESARTLAAFGVPVVESRLAGDADEAAAAASALGWPAVLKGMAPGVAHKSDLGLVALGLRDAGAVRRAHAAIVECAAAAGLSLEGVLVQRQEPAAVEAIVGLSREPGIGPVLVAGLGGIYAEALDDVATWVLPVDEGTLARDLSRTSLGRILESPRRRSGVRVAEVARVLLRLQDLALALGDRIAAVDINPLLLGDRAVAADALIVPSGARE